MVRTGSVSAKDPGDDHQLADEVGAAQRDQ
jgi:hypothetical protein